MLVQSYDGEIKLLPALPESWKNGKVTGLRARGGITIKVLEWRDRKVTKYETECNSAHNKTEINEMAGH